MKILSEREVEFLTETLYDAIYRTVGHSWQKPIEEVPVNNMCDSVANEFAVMLEDEFDYSVRSPVKAPVDSAKHFVAIITQVPNRNLKTPIVVDGTIRQFGDSYPTIVITPITSEEATELYDEIRL